ncbi:hypothetical protein ACFZAC_04400 [Pseudomonas fluorescens]|uniref:hypothetical protein n=1 Tax=Pseudomonas fluorescens TaxID=294 RepID=UPI0037482273
MLEGGQLSRFRMFCKKKYCLVGRLARNAEFIEGGGAFLPAAVVKMFQSIRLWGVT